MKEKVTDFLSKVLTFIIVVLPIALGAIIGHTMKVHYNHGICPNCGVEYVEKRAVWDSDSYTKWCCPECGKHGIILDILK